MKAEERHQLHRNALATKVGSLVETVREAPPSRTYMAGGFILLAIVLYIGWTFYSNYQESERSAAWIELDTIARNYDRGRFDLTEFADKQLSSIPGRSARFVLARNAYEDGMRNLNSTLDNERSVKQLKYALELYSNLSVECGDSPALADEAMMGMAAIEESLIGVPDPDKKDTILGSADKAATLYQELAKKSPESYLGKEAKKRADLFASNKEKLEKMYRELNQLINPIPGGEPKK